MKIYIDNIIFSLQRMGGISVVWYELLTRLLNSSFQLKIVEGKTLPDNPLRRSITIDQNYIIEKTVSNPFSRYLDVEIEEKEKFIFHSTYYRLCNNKNAINITTVHDFTYEYYSSGLKKWIHHWQKGRAISKADYVIAISENTKKDILKFCTGIDEEKIKVIYNGVSHHYQPLPESSLTNVEYPYNNYLLYVGSRDEYKNFRFVVDSIIDTQWNLVIVGPELEKEEIIFLNERIKNRYHCTGRVSDERLNELYNGAFAFVYPSLYEGFGIPVVEAQKAGCPVIAFNSSSIPEVIGDRRTLLNSLDIDEFISILKLLEINETRNDIVKKGLEKASLFSWEQTYKQLSDLYLKIVEETNS